MRKRQFFLWIILALLFLLALPGAACSRAPKVDLSQPEGVVEQFLKGQAEGNKRLVNALLTPGLKEKFQKKKLYLPDRVKLEGSRLDSREIQKTYDTAEMQVYELRFTVKAKNREKALRLREAVSVKKQGNNWLIDDYAPDEKV